MKRRDALAAVGLMIGVGQQIKVPLGLLTVDLNQYKAIRVRFGTDDYYVDPREVFEAFKEYGTVAGEGDGW